MGTYFPAQSVTIVAGRMEDGNGRDGWHGRTLFTPNAKSSSHHGRQRLSSGGWYLINFFEYLSNL